MVLFTELDWVPGNMSQAEDRAHRIGQKWNILIWHAVVDGSIDARMVRRLIEKQEVIDAALDTPTQQHQGGHPEQSSGSPGSRHDALHAYCRYLESQPEGPDDSESTIMGQAMDHQGHESYADLDIQIG